MAAPPTTNQVDRRPARGQLLGEEGERPQNDIACQRAHGLMVALVEGFDIQA